MLQNERSLQKWGLFCCLTISAAFRHRWKRDSPAPSTARSARGTHFTDAGTGFHPCAVPWFTAGVLSRQCRAPIPWSATMPLARIDLRKGKSADYLQRVGEAIYQAMRAVGVPENDRFQIFQQHDAGTLIYDPGYLGVDRTDDFICIQITWNEGRTLEQKKALYAGIADGLHAAVGIRREDVFINLVEVKKENWSFGNGVAQYVS
ncbi:tautomerase family protein [Stenotrophomonas maltophilia]|nr:tautomerase family protein [Stenotrophomonas maltophilia]